MKFYDLFSKYMPELKRGREQQIVVCIFHNDTKPSLSINLEKGVFHCFGCGKKGGIKEFCELVGENFENWKHLVLETERVLDEKEGTFIDLSQNEVKRIIETAHNRLLRSQAYLDFLINEKKWSRKIIERYKIGLEGDKIIIPIFVENDIVGVFQYKRQGNPKYKLIRYEPFRYEGCFPSKSLSSKYVVVCEGVSDTLCLLSLGISAVTPLIPMGANKHFLNFEFPENIVICTDNDDAGEIIRRKYTEFIGNLPGKKVYQLKLPEKYKDITDFIKENNKEAFIRLVEEAKKESEIFQEVQEEYEELEFEDIFSVRNFGKKISFEGFITAKLIQSYVLPETVSIKCTAGQHSFCNQCPVFILKTANPNWSFLVSEEDQISLIDKKQSNIESQFRKKLGVPSKCYTFTLETQSNNIAEIFEVIPLMGFGVKEIGYRPISCITLSKGILLSSSLSYKLYGRITKNPENSQLTIIVKNAKPIERKFDYDFSQDEAIKELMKVENNPEKIYEKLIQIGKDLSRYTGIKGRDLFHLVCFLPFVSPYQFIIDGEVEKAGLDLFIIGDTRTGKTTVIEKFCKLSYAQLVSGESVSYGGLVGGMQQLTYGKWMISWGIIPQNDRGLIAIDEADAISPELMGKLTSIRSTGIAEITKIQQARANARVRMIFIFNPKKGNIETYGYGIKSVLDFEYSKQDLSRFDLFYVLSQKDVQNPDYYVEETEIPIEVYKSLSKRAFSLSPIDVQISREIVEYSQLIGKELSSKYVSEIPAFTEGNAFLKIIRLAVAVSNLLITPITVELLFAIKKIISEIYDKEPTKFLQYSEMVRNENEIVSYNELEEELSVLGGKKIYFMRKIYSASSFSASDIREMTGLNQDELYQFISGLINQNAIKRNGRFYVKTPGFVRYIEQNVPDLGGK